MNKARLQSIGVYVKRDAGQEKVVCPKCSHTRKASNKKDPCLSVNIDEGIFNCHHCSWNGTVSEGKNKKQYTLPTYKDGVLTTDWLSFFDSRGIERQTLIDMNVTMESVWMPQEQKEVDTVIFNYFRNDVLINKKYRTLGKGFKMEKDAELVFYNLDNMEEDIVVIVEGEMDVLSFAQAGIISAISVPNGASKGNNNLQYLDNCADYLSSDKVKTVILATDNDEPGLKLRDELARRLGKNRCKIVHYPEGCKDANDVLLKHGAEAVQGLIKTCEFYPLDGIIPSKDYFDGTMDLYKNGVDKGDAVGFQDCYGRDGEGAFDRLLTFKTSTLTMVTGIPSHGKSSFLNQVEVLLAVKCGWKFGIFSPEHYPLQYLTYRYAELLVGKPFFKGKTGERMNEMELRKALEFINEHFFFIRPPNGSAKMDYIIELGKQLVMRHGIKGFTIDPWNTIDHDYGSQGSETLYVEKSLNKLTAFKQDCDLAVFVVAHPRKMGKIKDSSSDLNGMHEVPSLYDISGSKSFYDKADVGICVYRNFETNVVTVHVQKVKFKHIGEIGVADFKYSVGNSRYYPCSNDGHTVDEYTENHIKQKLKQGDLSQQLNYDHVQEAEWEADPEDEGAWMNMKNHRNNDNKELPF